MSQPVIVVPGQVAACGPEATRPTSGLRAAADAAPLEKPDAAQVSLKPSQLAFVHPAAPRHSRNSDGTTSSTTSLHGQLPPSPNGGHRNSWRANLERRRPSTSSGESDVSLQGRTSVISRRSSTQQKIAPSASSIRLRRFGQALGRVVDSRSWNLVSVLFTIYALFGDDFRLLATEKPADSIFNVLVLMCLLFFLLEIVLKCIAQSDYFLGFFFVLDCVATSSLILDLTWVADLLQEGAVGDSGGQARSGRTARVGASLGRVVRVLRLVRVLKLYKAYYEKRNIRDTRKQGSSGIFPGNGDKASQVSDNWDSDNWDDGGQPEDATGSESLVGKRLVALTTRKVILLVLLMLLALPFLMVPTSEMFSSSAAWGADSVWQTLMLYRTGAGTREAYEQNLLRYLYYHNWFDGHGDCSNGAQDCANAFHAHAFWIGVGGKAELETLRSHADVAEIRASSIASWEKRLAGIGNTLYSVGTFPPEAHDALAAPWQEVCDIGGVRHLGLSILSQEVPGVLSHTIRCPLDLRPVELRVYSPRLLRREQFDDWRLVFFFDIRPFVKAGATFGILTTVFICIVLTVASVLFSADANNLVLAPIERMIAKVNTIRDNPLQAIKMADAQFEVEEAKKHRERRKKESIRQSLCAAEDADARQKVMEVCRRLSAWIMSLTKSREEEAIAETAVLEKTIIKLGTLLALGFGHAGVNIVSNNMSALDSAGVNAMIPGVVVDCIIGYAKISNFSTATEVLQTKIMTFVNQIAEIVHGLATEYHGAPNKNNGDTFLIIWRVEDYDHKDLTRLSDMSILAFARMLGQVHMSPVLARYRTHPGLQQRLGSRCRVDLSFGLHRGWAIEGAVGSDFKIDASYLSPNVSIAESLEAATHVYKVHLIASEPVIASCTPAIAKCCRVIDKAMIRGSKAPLALHVFDLDVTKLEVETVPVVPWSVRQRFRARQLLEVKKKQKWNMALDLLDEAQEVAKMRESYTEAFFQYFIMGYQNYAEGEWSAARVFLVRTFGMLGFEDGPSKALLAFMERHKFQAPDGWRGVRRFAGDGVGAA